MSSSGTKRTSVFSAPPLQLVSAAVVPLTDVPEPGHQPDESLLLMEDALQRLARLDPVKVQLIDMRFFGGMTAEESATVLGMSVHLVRRELRLAQAWLHKEMRA